MTEGVDVAKPGGFRREAPRPPRASARLSGEIERRVASRFGVRRAGLRAVARSSDAVAFARHVAMYLERVLLELPYGDIARRFGRHPTTVSYACRRIEDLRDDAAFDRRIGEIEDAVLAAMPGAGT